MDNQDMLALGVVGLMLWLLLRSRQQVTTTNPGQKVASEIVTSNITYGGVLEDGVI